MTRLLLGLALLGLLGLLAAELLLQPAGAERLQLAALLGGVSLVSMLLAVTLQRFTRSSLAHGVLATSLVAVVVAGIAVTAAASAMFLNDHDLRLVLVALGLGVGAGVALATGIVRPLVRDLDRVGRTARAVASGRRDVRTEVDREDELGETAAALDRLVEQLEEAEADRERVEAARARFLAAVGHDLRSPLTVLRSGLEALEDDVVDDVGGLVDRLQRETDLLGSLVEDLFLLARIESDGLRLRRQRLDLSELADEAVEALTGVAAQRGVRLRVDAPDSAPVEGDARELGRVLRNLLDNAVRHTPDGSVVTVDVTTRDGRVHCRVLDEGPGFPAELGDEVFGSFVRGDSARTRDGAGAGLGLAIARGLVDAHDGHITTGPGPGGRVDVVLPAVP